VPSRTLLNSSHDYKVAKLGNMNQVGSQYFECEFHSSGPFTDSGVTVFAREIEDKISKPLSDEDVMIPPSKTMHPLCSEKDSVLTEEEMTSTDKVIRIFCLIMVHVGFCSCFQLI